MSKKVAILGSTGSIGTTTLEVVKEHPDQFEVVALAAGTQVERMIQQAQEFHPKIICMATKEASEKVSREVSGVNVLWGESGLEKIATLPETTHLVAAMVGSLGLLPTIKAAKAGKVIGLANKETLVIAGHLFKKEIEKSNCSLLPIDSEHSAIYQCLNGERQEDVTKIILTASGGPFRDWDVNQLKEVTVEKALQHPNWSMGRKITIDSATMMNKGLEVIEAHWLFDIAYDQIEVLIHPQSIVHSMVEFQDGAVMAQLGTPDMKVPIQYALAYPERLSLNTERLNFKKYPQLDFREPDFTKYPSLEIAIEAGRMGGITPTVLNAANEVAVAGFLDKKCSFLGMKEILLHCLERHESSSDPCLEEILEADRWTRHVAIEFIEK